MTTVKTTTWHQPRHTKSTATWQTLSLFTTLQSLTSSNHARNTMTPTSRTSLPSIHFKSQSSTYGQLILSFCHPQRWQYEAIIASFTLLILLCSSLLQLVTLSSLPLLTTSKSISLLIKPSSPLTVANSTCTAVFVRMQCLTSSSDKSSHSASGLTLLASKTLTFLLSHSLD